MITAIIIYLAGACVTIFMRGYAYHRATDRQTVWQDHFFFWLWPIILPSAIQAFGVALRLGKD